MGWRTSMVWALLALPLMADTGTGQAGVFLVTYSGYNYYKVPASGAMSSTNVDVTCKAAGHVTPCAGTTCQGDCVLLPNLNNCSWPMDQLAKAVCGGGHASQCPPLDQTYIVMQDSWREGSACGVEMAGCPTGYLTGPTCYCATGNDYSGRYALCARDLNACSPNPCHAQAICKDNPAPDPDECICNVGYTGDGRLDGTGCSDINACSSNPCHAQATCTDNPAPALDANCTCNVGYTGDGRLDGTGCSACSINPCHAQATCTDIPPSLDGVCVCNFGYKGDGRLDGTGCLDINACLSNPCHAQATCTDNPAPALDANCTCNVGYTGDGRLDGTGCSDINACSSNPCHAQATCTDNPAPALDANCTCNVGYTGDGRLDGTGCSDINTCSNASNPCHAQATCTDNPAPALDANCTCNAGYAGDGALNGTGCSLQPVSGAASADMQALTYSLVGILLACVCFVAVILILVVLRRRKARAGDQRYKSCGRNS
ncbi:uncharacterized protein LOC144913661 isoform X5 [Branchiostoma floridae x Branchiostoma belcheri]